MTCREFKHTAASLTLWELSGTRDAPVLDHAAECPKCGAWLDRQQLLAVSMQALQARNAGREAGPHVERALLRMFRQVPFEAMQPVAAPRSTPIALRLSRFFELGAYAAVAAAIVVGLFLGMRLLEHHSTSVPVQAQVSPARTVAEQPMQAATNATQEEATPAMHQQPPKSAKSELAARSIRNGQPSSAAVWQDSDDPEYVALMFCDPLSCSSDAEVVRMELPASGTASDRAAQPQIADVVVGYDGIVRAMRIVN
jgi:hypothetical protein